jgi:hypothetical protein
MAQDLIELSYDKERLKKIITDKKEVIQEAKKAG